MSEPLETTDGTDFDLLFAVKDRLHARISKLKEGLVMICDEPVPPKAYFPAGDLACSLALTDGVFYKAKYDCGGANQLCERKSLVITIFQRSNIDQPPRAEHAMLDKERGMLAKWKPAVLSAVLVDDPAADLLAPWHPKNKSGQNILRGSIVPDRSQGPREMTEGSWLGLSLFFDVEFDWNLRTPITG